MRMIPVDVSGLRFLAMGSPAPWVRNRTTGEVATDGQGRSLWFVPLAVVGAPGERDGQTLRVAIPAEEPPELTFGAPVRVVGLCARVWERDGKSGVSFRAERVEPVGG